MKKTLFIYLFIAVCSLFSPGLFGQLSGSYTINGSSPTAGTNYQTFTAAVSALSTSGVSGAVTFNVLAGTYTEQVVIPAISGASTTNTITFKGLGDLTTLSATPSSTNLPVLSLVSASHIIIDSLKIEVLGTDGFAVHFMNNADSITIQSSHIVAPAISTCHAIMASGSISSVSNAGIDAEYITIKNNLIEGGNSAIFIRGATAPLTVPSKKANFGKGYFITGNTIKDFSSMGVDLSFNSNIIFNNNTVTTSSTSAGGALRMWDAGDDMTIDANKFYIASNTANTRVVTLAMAPPNGSAGEVLEPIIFSNNFVHYAGTNTTKATGLLLKNKAYVKVYNNTFKTKNQGSDANCIWLDANNNRDLDGIEIRNNIMYLDNSGSGHFIYNAAKGDVFKGMLVDHNNYYCENGYFDMDIPNGTAGTTSFTSFAAYKSNSIGYGTGALNVDPEFISPTDLHVKSVAMNDSGAVISAVTHDIDGQTRSTTYPDMGADEFVPPTCLPSTALGAFNILATSAEVYWTQSNTGSSVKLKYGLTGFTLGSGTSMTPTNDTVALSGLTAQTTYDVYIKEICSATDSSAWTSFSFTTGCGIISTYPYSEGFEGSNWVSGSGSNNTGSAVDPCWTVSPNSTSIYSWGTRSGTTTSSSTGPTSGFGGSGNYMFTESSTGSTGDKADFTSPSFDLSPLNSPQISFRYHMYGSAMGTLMLWAWNGSAYDTVMTISGDQGNAWEEMIVDLSGYKNDTVHFVFHAVKGSSYTSDMAIDTVVIGEAPPCPKPTVVTLDSITSTSMRINFLSSGTKFIYEYGPTGFSQGTGATGTILGSGHVFSGLASSTAYDFYIKNDCTDSAKGVSPWVGPFSARTLCAYTNAYFTDWDHLANNETDFCWTFLAYGSTAAYARAYDPPTTSALQSFSGNMYYRVYNSSSTDNFLISPEISALASNTLQLRFQGSDTYTGTTGTPAFYIGTMASLSDTGSFVAMDTIITTTDVWNEFTVALSSVPANHKHVVIIHADNANNVYMAIDDLHIELQPACVPPSSGTFSNVRDTSVAISWTAGDGNTFELEYGFTGFTQGFGTTISSLTNTTANIGGLLPDTCYEFYIRGNCTNNNSPWYGPISVCTECSTLMAPYLENFDGPDWVTGSITTNQIEDCWSRTPVATSGYRWQTNSGTTTSSSTGPSTDVSGTGKYVYTEASSGTNGAITTLNTPNINFGSLVAPTLSFSYHMYGSTMGELYILISNGAQHDTLQVITGQHQTSNAAAWKTAYIDLTPYNSAPRSIQFLGKRGSSYFGDIAIDEVSVDEFPTCIIPSNFNLDSVSSTFADFSWYSQSNGTAFKMEYGPVGFSQGSNTGGVVRPSSSPSRVSGLTPNTSYDIYLTDLCDSTAWIGPITFTTLINDDAEVQSILSPANLTCGDSSYVVEIKVKNNGLNPINSLPIGANVSGAINATISNTYTGTIAPGASVIIPVGTINSYFGGLINVQCYTALSGDQDILNDTLQIQGIEIISAEPVLYPIDTLCANDTSGQFIAKSQSGVINNWYYNISDTLPFAMGDTVSVLPNQTLYLDRSKEVDQLILDIDGFSNFGNMFKLYIKKDMAFTGFTFEPASNGTAEPIAFYKQGTWQGFETDKSAWTAIDSAVITGGINNTWMNFMFGAPVNFSAGDTISLYIANKMNSKMETKALSQVSLVGDLYLANDDFEYYAGATGAYFGSNMASGGPRAVSSILHYNSNDVCGSNRIALTMGVNNDTAIASFTTVVNANGADVDFDATASMGQVYDWDFGDGNTGTGVITSNTYATAGSYTVTLVVTDTVCGTTDTSTSTVLATVSLNELVLNGKVEVYPNPNSGKFNVNLDLVGGQDVQLALTNTLGQLVYAKDLGRVGGHVETELNIQGLAPGIYYLRVMGNDKSKTIKITIL